MVNWGVVEFPFSVGVDTKSDPKQVTKFLSLQNCVMTSPGRLQKRNGYSPLSTTLTTGNTLSTLGSSLVQTDNNFLYSYSPIQQSWFNRGLKPVIGLSVSSIVSNQIELTTPDIAMMSNGTQLFTFVTGGASIGFSLFDSQAKTPILPLGPTTSGFNAKPWVNGTDFAVFCQTASNVSYFTVNPTSPPTSITTTNLVSTDSSNTPFDMCTDGTNIYLFYINAAGHPALSKVSNSYSVTTVSLTTESAIVVNSVYDSTNSYVWLFWGDRGENLRVAIYDTALTQILAPSLIAAVSRNISATVQGGVATLFSETSTQVASGSYLQTITNQYAVNIGTVTTSGAYSLITTVQNLTIASKPFVNNSNVHVLLSYASSVQPTYFLGRLYSGSIQFVGKLASGTGGGPTGILTLPQVSGTYYIPYLNEIDTSIVAGTVTSIKALSVSKWDFSQSYQGKLNLANTLLIGGGIISSFDGQTVTEQGFNLFPEQPNVTVLPFGGALFSNASYSWTTVYSYPDAKGQINRSSPAVPLSLKTPSIFFQALASLTSGSPTITVNTNLIGNLIGPPDYWPIGATLSGTGIPSNTTIVSIVNTPGPGGHNEYTITMSQNASQTISTTVGVTFSQTLSGEVVSNFDGVASYQINITPPPGPYLFWGVSTADGSYYVPNAVGLVSGSPYTLQQGTSSLSGTITSINGNYVTLSSVPSEAKYVAFTVSAYSSALGFVFPGQQLESNSVIYNVLSVIEGSAGNAIVTVDQPITLTNLGVTFTVNNPLAAVILLPPLSVTNKQNVTVEIYRTIENGTTYYMSGASTNIPNQVQIAIGDSVGDATLTGNQQLYTTGGEVDNISAPASRLFTEFKNRAIVVPSESPLSWWFSKQVIPGSPVEFSDAFIENVDNAGGDITAIGVLDEKLILFKANTIFYVVGTGPAPNGSNDDFTYPQQLAVDVGCSNQASLVQTPLGIMFQSAKGIYLLDRSLNTRYIGADVESYNSDTVTSATLMPDTTQVRFTLNSGVVLVYDYYLSQWYTWTNINAVDTALLNGVYYWLSASGVVSAETPGLYLDNTSPISMAIQTAWIKLSGIQGYQRSRQAFLIGDYISPHTLNVSISQNYNPAIIQSDSIPVGQSLTPLQYRLYLNNQKCESVQFTISDSNTTGASLSLSGLALELGTKRGPYKLPAAQGFG